MSAQDAANALIANPPAALTINPYVIAFQKAYNAENSPPLTFDGVYGPETRAALSKYGAAPPVPTQGYGTPGVVQASGVLGGGQVPCVITPVTAQSMLNMLAAVWPAVVGGTPNLTALRVLLAQSAYETAAWRGMRNWNFGNKKRFPGSGEDWFLMADDCKLPNGDPTECPFESKTSMQAGVTSFMSLLYNGYRWAWPYVLKGDTDGFVTAIKSGGPRSYFSSNNVAGYQAGVKSYYNQFQSLVPQGVTDDGTSPDGGGGGSSWDDPASQDPPAQAASPGGSWRAIAGAVLPQIGPDPLTQDDDAPSPAAAYQQVPMTTPSNALAAAWPSVQAAFVPAYGTQTTLNGLVKSLSARYPAFQSWPADAQLAILRWASNVSKSGPAGYGPNWAAWPKLDAALSTGNFALANVQTHWVGESDDLASDIIQMLQNAVDVQQNQSDPSVLVFQPPQQAVFTPQFQAGNQPSLPAATAAAFGLDAEVRIGPPGIATPSPWPAVGLAVGAVAVWKILDYFTGKG